MVNHRTNNNLSNLKHGNTLKCVTWKLRYFIIQCDRYTLDGHGLYAPCVADIRGGKISNNSLVRLDHLFI